jgi:hypothetical protein
VSTEDTSSKPTTPRDSVILLRKVQTMTARSAGSYSADQMPRFSAPPGRHPLGEARVATSGSCSGPGGVDVSLGMTTQVLLFEFRGPTGVLPEGVRHAVQERTIMLRGLPP